MADGSANDEMAGGDISTLMVDPHSTSPGGRFWVLARRHEAVQSGVRGEER